MQLRLVILAAAAVLVFFGITELVNMPVDILPEFSRPYVEVQTEALGLSADEVEAMITVPLEADMLNGVPWADEIRSESIPGLSSIVIFFEPGTEMMVARQLVQERLVSVHALPNVSKPPAMMQPLSSSGRVMKIGMTSNVHSAMDMSVLAQWTVLPRLMSVPGVANVSIWGERRRQLQVLVDPAKLHAEGIGLRQIIESTGNALWVSPLTFLDASVPGTGGWIETPNQRLGIRHLLPISTPEDLAKIAVSGTTKRLGELTQVVEDHQPLIGDTVIGDEPALMLVVEKFPWANTTDVTAGVEQALVSLKQGLSGIEMDSSLFRPATYLELAMGNLSRIALLAIALIVGAFFLLTLNWRATAVSSAVLVVSVMAAAFVLYVRGTTLNMIILAGFAVGLASLIDDAVIDIQNIMARMREKRREDADKSTALMIFEGTLEMRRPMVYATLMILLAVVPLYFLSGMAGAFAQPIVASYSLALLASISVALTLTPAMSLMLLGDAVPEDRGSPVLGVLRRAFDGLLDWSAQVPGTGVKVLVGATGAAILIGLVAFPPLAPSLLPDFRERDILVELDAAPGTSEVAMRRILARASQELRQIAGVRNVSAILGRAVRSDRVSDVSAGELWVNLQTSADYDATLAEIREIANGYPGFDVDVQTYLSERIQDEAREDENLVVRIYGEDLAELRSKAVEIQKMLVQVAGVVEAEVDYPEEHPSLEIEVDLVRAQRYGLKPGDVRRSAATLLSGIQVGSLFEDQKVFDVLVWGTPEVRRDVSAIKNLLIDTPMGSQVRLREVASVRISSAQSVLNREAVARYIDVIAEVDADIASVTDAAEGLIRKLDFPLEMRAEVMGASAERSSNRRRIAGFSVAGAIGIVLLLQAAFGSWSLAFLFFLSLPLAIVGGVAAALLATGSLSLGSVLGLVAVLAIAIRQGLALVRHYRELEKQEDAALSRVLVLRGTRDRFAPVVTTAIATALGFLPFALFGNIAGLEILNPMAIAVLGGLLTSTLVTLAVVPALFLGYGAVAEADVILEEEPPRLVA
jgi:Cu/Ag efflux pump CusA